MHLLSKEKSPLIGCQILVESRSCGLDGLDGFFNAADGPNSAERRRGDFHHGPLACGTGVIRNLRFAATRFDNGVWNTYALARPSAGRSLRREIPSTISGNMTVSQAAKCMAFALLLVVLGGAFVCGKLSSIADEERALRCADMARGKLIVGEVDALVAESSVCPVHEMEARTHATNEVGEKPTWSIDIDPRECGYTLHKLTRPGWPIGASVRLDYDSRSKKWELLCEGERSRMVCP
jgi:hypothetical protein